MPWNLINLIWNPHTWNIKKQTLHFKLPLQYVRMNKHLYTIEYLHVNMLFQYFTSASNIRGQACALYTVQESICMLICFSNFLPQPPIFEDMGYEGQVVSADILDKSVEKAVEIALQKTEVWRKIKLWRRYTDFYFLAVRSWVCSFGNIINGATAAITIDWAYKFGSSQCYQLAENFGDNSKRALKIRFQFVVLSS